MPFVPDAEASRQLLRRWQTMSRLHRANPELGLAAQIEAADTLDADPYARLRLLLHEKGAGRLRLGRSCRSCVYISAVPVTT